MKATLTSLFSGTLFGAGLAVSQMTNPAKVIAFLDVAGSWDPSLAFVMGVAVLVSAVAFQIARIRSASAGRLAPPGSAGIDARLLAGAAIFGLGWGLAGFCPGPAVASLVTGSSKVVLFICCMIVGMGLYKLVAQPGSAVKDEALPAPEAPA